MAKERNRTFNIFDNPWKKYRTFKTVALFASFLSLGLAGSCLGPTIVSMEILLGTDTKSIAAAFSGGSIGYLSGAVLCGFVYKHMHKELLFAIATFAVSVATGLVPFSWNLQAFVAACSVQGFFMAMIDTGGQSYVLKLWEGHKYKEPILQAIHCIWSLGATIGPFIIRPFLLDIRTIVEDRSNNSITLGDGIVSMYGTALENNSTFISQTDSYNDDGIGDFTGRTELPFNTTLGNEVIKDKIGYIRFAFVIIASLILTCSVLFMIAFALMKPSCRDRIHEKQTEGEKTQYSKSYRRFRIILLVFMFLFYFSYLWVEGVPASFLAAFVVKGLDWPNNYGALMVSTYWGSHGLGRVFGIPIAAFVSPRNMLIGDLVVTAVGFSLLLFVNLYENIIWVGVVVAGLGMGSIFASAILWLEGYMEVTGAASSVLLTASSAGGIVSPLLTGYLFDEVSHMCFVYVVVTASICEIVIFIGSYFFAQKNGRSNSKRKNVNIDRLSSKDEPVELASLNSDKNDVQYTRPTQMKNIFETNIPEMEEMNNLKVSVPVQGGAGYNPFDE